MSPTATTTDRRREPPFETAKEQARRERIERLLGTTPKLTTAARLFDDAAYREATALARGSKQSTEVESL